MGNRKSKREIDCNLQDRFNRVEAEKNLHGLMECRGKKATIFDAYMEQKGHGRTYEFIFIL